MVAYGHVEMEKHVENLMYVCMCVCRNDRLIRVRAAAHTPAGDKLLHKIYEKLNGF